MVRILWFLCESNHKPRSTNYHTHTHTKQNPVVASFSSQLNNLEGGFKRAQVIISAPGVLQRRLMRPCIYSFYNTEQLLAQHGRRSLRSVGANNEDKLSTVIEEGHFTQIWIQNTLKKKNHKEIRTAPEVNVCVWACFCITYSWVFCVFACIVCEVW